MTMIESAGWQPGEMKSMFSVITRSNSRMTVVMLVFSVLIMACASEAPLVSDQPVEPSFQEKVMDCSKIGDRGERDRCLYGG